MKIILSNCIEIQQPTKEIIDFVKKKLTYKNPEVEKKKRMGFYAYGVPKEIKLYNEYNGKLYVPYGFFQTLYDFFPYKEYYVDYTSTVSATIKSNIVLRDYQQFGLRAIKEHYNGLFVLPCGLGKTELALQCAYELKQKTIFVTHTTDLVKQAKERCESKMICKTSTITEGKCDTSGDIVFCTIQTLYKMIEKRVVKQNEFGFLIADECFPKGTKINTPNGYKNIENIHEGDIVYSYNHKTNKIEEKEVDYLFHKKSNNILRITLQNGKTIICTNNHPIYTSRGYIRADEIEKGDVLYEMCNVWENDKQRDVYKRTMGTQNAILQNKKCNLLFQRMWEKTINRLFGKKKQNIEETGNDFEQSDERLFNKTESIKHIKKNTSPTKCERGEWDGFNHSTKDVIRRTTETQSGMYSRIPNKNRYEKRKWLSQLLQGRHSDIGKQNSHRNRWKFSLCFGKTGTRQEKNNILRKLRVESVEIQKQVCHGKYTSDYQGIDVYNIGVKDNHNYFVDNILVHNCHRVATNPSTIEMFRSCIDYFACRYKLGLTATLHRADGLEGCITKIIGEVIYEVVKRKDNYVCVYEGKDLLSFSVSQFQVPAYVKILETDYTIEDKQVFAPNGGTIQFASLISDLAMNKERNEELLKVITNIKGSTLILSDRVEQLKYLCTHVENGVEIDGTTPKKQRERAINDVRNGKIKYLFASYSLAKEGLDVPIIENLVMATPVKDFAIVQQSIGRIQRPYPGKTIARVYDFTDSNVGMLIRFFRTRRSTYRKNNWEIENIYLGSG